MSAVHVKRFSWPLSLEIYCIQGSCAAYHTATTKTVTWSRI